MARSSGGGSRGGGSRSSSSRSHGGSSRRVSHSPFPGSRKFRYYRNGAPYYVYSNEDLTQIPDAKPRWFLIFFYLPFIFAIVGMFLSVVSIPMPPLTELSSANIEIVDKSDVFSQNEKSELLLKLNEFKTVTGITTQIITIDYDEWTDNGSLEKYAYYRYYAQFDDENSWLLIYSEENQGLGNWAWEGVQGDNTIAVMDVFLEDFNTILHSSLMVDDDPDVAKAFEKAFDKAIDLFKNQKTEIDSSLLFPALFMTAFIAFHSYVMIFAGTRKKYSNKELEEVGEDESIVYGTDGVVIKSCPYCGKNCEKTVDHRCPHCNSYL